MKSKENTNIVIDNLEDAFSKDFIYNICRILPYI